MTKADVENVIREVFDETKMATATVGPKRKPLTI